MSTTETKPMKPSDRIAQLSQEMNQRDLDEHRRKHLESGLLQFEVRPDAIVAYLDEQRAAQVVSEKERELYGAIAGFMRPAIPRGIVAIESDGRIELWFTNEVKPPEWVTLGHVDIVSAVAYQAGRKWEDVERWRFTP